MKHYVREWLISTLMWVGLMLSIPLAGLAQERPLELNLKKGIGEMPTLRSSVQKLVSKIEIYYKDNIEEELNFSYDETGRVISMSDPINGYAIYYEKQDDVLSVSIVPPTGMHNHADCTLNEFGYIVSQEIGGNTFFYTYDSEGQTLSMSMDGDFETLYVWEDRNLIESEGFQRETYVYSNVENKANLNFCALFWQAYDVDTYQLGLCGYIGNKSANLASAIGKTNYKYDLDEDGYVTTIYQGSNNRYVISYDGSSSVIPDPDPTPGEDTPEDEFIDAIEQAPEGSEENPTEIFIPTGGVTLHQPLDINKHIRLTGGSLMRGEDNPYAMLRVREGYSLDLDGVTIDGGNTDLQDGSIIVYGKLRMREGSQLKNCYRTEAGTPSGAICVAQSGYVRMDEGVTISGNTGSYGSAIYCEGFFEMYGGEISGNSGQIGAVVVNSGGTFRMHDGKISGNKVTEGCGGIYVGEGCRFEIYSGEVSDNAHSDIYAWSNVYAGSPAKVDGLVYFAEGNRLQVMDTLQHDWTITFLGEPQPGTVVAVGYTTYHLTEADLNHIHYADDTYKLALDGNTIVITKDATGIEEIVKPRLIVMKKTIRMENYPENVPYVVYNMYGRTCLSGEIDGVGQATFSLSNPGIYIVKCQNETYKVKVK